eukprot:7253609-Prymnesium_polylepis.1
MFECTLSVHKARASCTQHCFILSELASRSRLTVVCRARVLPGVAVEYSVHELECGRDAAHGPVPAPALTSVACGRLSLSLIRHSTHRWVGLA